jgi:hypothetical protein
VTGRGDVLVGGELEGTGRVCPWEYDDWERDKEWRGEPVWCRIKVPTEERGEEVGLRLGVPPGTGDNEGERDEPGES